MKPTGLILAGALLSGCASLGSGGGDGNGPEETWEMAHQALAVEDFERAEALFQRIVSDHPDGSLGRESIFYLGAMRLDPRNPAWDSKPAEDRLRQYTSLDSAGHVVARRPEAEILLQLAAQLNMPAQERVPGLQPETQVVVRTRPQRVVVPAQESRQLASEVARLRRDVAARDSTIAAQREELERIRRTLTGREGGNRGRDDA